MDIAFNSSNPYIFTYALSQHYENYVNQILTNSYSPYEITDWLLAGLIFRHLKNVRFQFANHHQVKRRLSKVTVVNERNDFPLMRRAIEFGIIDTAALYFSIEPISPHLIHLPPFGFFHSFVIVSTVSADSRRESSEKLSVQGLSSPVWVLVCFSLIVVSGLATYLSFENEKNIRRKKPFNWWMNSVWIYAADILNNCVALVLKPGPGRHLRSWWLLAVVFLIQFWRAGMKSDILLDHSSFVDSLEDLLSKPELLCLMSRNSMNVFLVKDDPRYHDYQRRKARYIDNMRDENSNAILSSGSGVIIVEEKLSTNPNYPLFKRLKETNRKKYIGKERYNGQYAYMLFNKRLPRVIKEDIDYLTSRLTETRQSELRARLKKFKSRKYIFDSKENSAAIISWSPQSLNYLSTAFRLWVIGNSLATIILCVECFRRRVFRRRPVKVSPYTFGIWNRA